MTLKRLILISRPIGYIFNAAIYILGLVLSGASYSNRMLLGAFLLTLPVNLLIFGLNDIFDIKSDTYNIRKGGSQGAIAHVTEKSILKVYIAFTAVLILTVGYITGGFGYFISLLGIVILAYAYSVPPIRLKTRPIFDSISNGLGVILLLLCGYWFGQSIYDISLPNIGLLLALFSFTVGLHITYTLTDYESDKIANDKTVAVQFGKNFARLISLLAFSISAVFLYLNISTTLIIYILSSYVFAWIVIVCLSFYIDKPRIYSKIQFGFLYIGVILCFVCIYIKLNG